VAHAVKVALGRGVDLAELSLAELQAVEPRIGDDAFGVLTLEGSLNARNLVGGTAPAQVRAQVARHRARLG
jgi:argininosuccinate lyase